MAEKWTKGDNPCIAKAGDDEPLFVLRAQDATSDGVVQAWIDANVARLGFDHPKIANAARLRDAMAAWPNRKLPD